MTPTTKKVLIIVGIVLGALVLICCSLGALAIWLAPKPAPSASAVQYSARPAPAASSAPPSTSPTDPATTSASTPPRASPFDRATFDAWWVSGAVPPSVANATTSVEWSGLALVAHTRIVNDADAPGAARKVCSALSAFWLTTGDGQFRPVQVLDAADQVLVSRRSEAEACTWRR